VAINLQRFLKVHFDRICLPVINVVQTEAYTKVYYSSVLTIGFIVEEVGVGKSRLNVQKQAHIAESIALVRIRGVVRCCGIRLNTQVW